MNSSVMQRYVVLLKREMWESNKLFIASPVVLSVLLLVATLWTVAQIPGDVKAEGIVGLGALLDGTSPSQIVAPLMVAAIPFVLVLYICSVIYLLNALYHDRKDGSILFWQSMPVSNLETVIAKIVTVSFIAPAITAAASGILILVVVLATSIIGAQYNVEAVSFWTLLMTGLYSIILIYLTSVLAALWLFPTIGWILLFSAYARSLPLLWAIGGFVLLLFLEDLVFGSQFLGNWLQSRVGNYDYIVFSISDFFRKLFSYDLLIGILFGGLLTTGAVYMRRYAD